jgi:hypothetical protein
MLQAACNGAIDRLIHRSDEIQFVETRMKSALVRNIFRNVVLGCLCVVMIACGSSLTGKYSAAGGAIMLELQSGGKATLSFAGETAPCTYTSSGKTVTLACQGQAGSLALTVQSDGSLAGPPGSLIPPLQKTK